MAYFGTISCESRAINGDLMATCTFTEFGIKDWPQGIAKNRRIQCGQKDAARGCSGWCFMPVREGVLQRVKTASHYIYCRILMNIVDYCSVCFPYFPPNQVENSDKGPIMSHMIPIPKNFHISGIGWSQQLLILEASYIFLLGCAVRES
jgi:hypothetical protein